MRLALSRPAAVTDEERAAVAAYLFSAARGGEGKPLDLGRAIAARGHTIATFAAACGVSERLVAYWLRRERQPSRETARRIARVLGLSPIRVLPNFAIQHASGPTLAGSAPYDPSLPLLGRNLAAARASLGLTQRALAEGLAVAPVAISQCERGCGDNAILVRVQHDIGLRLRQAASAPRRRGRPRKVVAPQP